jgi:hypothetical protein
MNMPGFTAEASVYKPTERYHMSGVITGRKPNTVEPAQVCGPCDCRVRCYGSGIFRNCEFLCSQSCLFCAEPIGCFRVTRPCSPFRFGG